MSNNEPRKWHEVYQGDEECRFFKELCRGENTGKHGYRSIAGLASTTKLGQKRVEEIIAKYLKQGLILSHSEKSDTFRYWQFAEKEKQEPSIVQADREKQIKGAKGP